MNRARLLLVVVLALSAGGVLAYGTYSYVQNAPSRAAAVATEPVVVSASDLPIGTELKADDLRVVQWPAAAVPRGAFTQPAALIGRGLVLPVVENEPILPVKLASKEAGAGLPPAIPQGMRALSVRVNEVIGVAGYVLPGTRVDVVATASPTDNHTDTTSKVVLTNVQVLAAGTRIEQDGDKGKPISVNVVTLLVTPVQAERLTLASTEGKIQLALRNPLDLSAPETPGVRPAMLLGMVRPVVMRPVAHGNKASTAPALVPEPLPSVEMIRGDKRTTEVIR